MSKLNVRVQLRNELLIYFWPGAVVRARIMLV